MVRRRLTHFPSRRWRTKREVFDNLLCLSSFSILLRFSRFLFSHTFFRLDHTTFGDTRDSAGDSICARATRETIYDLPVIFVDRGLFRTAICLRISRNFTSVIFEEKDFLRMAQTYNQKRNVYTIDQILGHGKDEGMINNYFLFFLKKLSSAGDN